MTQKDDIVGRATSVIGTQTHKNPVVESCTQAETVRVHN